jgi:hypothetical protein
MRRWWLVAASSTFHITKLTKRHDGSTERMKLKFRIWIIVTWHEVNTEFHEFPCCFSIVIKYVQTDTPS